VSAFELDTPGFVLQPSEHYVDEGPCAVRWSDLTPFCQGYVEALFAALRTGDIGHWPDHLAAKIGFKYLAPETLARIIDDCGAMRATGQALPDHYVGEMFWRRRQAGDWKVAQRAAGGLGPVPAFPPLTPYLGDDGKVYLREVGQ
jgi:hypothetical protein